MNKKEYFLRKDIDTYKLKPKFKLLCNKCQFKIEKPCTIKK